MNATSAPDAAVLADASRSSEEELTRQLHADLGPRARRREAERLLGLR